MISGSPSSHSQAFPEDPSLSIHSYLPKALHALNLTHRQSRNLICACKSHLKLIAWIIFVMHSILIFADSPGVPPSANAHELFRGFSFVAPNLVDEMMQSSPPLTSKLTTSNNNNNNAGQEGSGNQAQHSLGEASQFMSGLQLANSNGSGHIIDACNSGIDQLSVALPKTTKCKERRISEYEFLEELGRGAFSICRRCIHKSTRQEYAVKVRIISESFHHFFDHPNSLSIISFPPPIQIIDKKKRDPTEEVEILLRFGSHPNIITLHDVYEDKDHVFLFMDLMRGGELLDRIISQKYFSEREASQVMQVIASTIKYLHDNGVSCPQRAFHMGPIGSKSNCSYITPFIHNIFDRLFIVISSHPT